MKRGRGRPPTPAASHHSEILHIRMAPALLARIRRDADAAGVTLSELCRARLDRGDGGREDLERAHAAGYMAGAIAIARQVTDAIAISVAREHDGGADADDPE